jgi:hypothetical protein
MTTGRVGSFEVSGVLVDHYRPVGVVSWPVVWVSVPVPLTIEHVAALLYDTADSEEVAVGDLVGARRLVVDVVAGGGWVAVSEAVEGVATQRARGTLSMTHWRECQRLASLVVTGADASTVPDAVALTRPLPSVALRPVNALGGGVKPSMW